MSYSLYQASVPTFVRSLNAFLAILDKAEAHAAAAKFDPQIYLTLRLRPDMFAFARQVQAFCDHAKIASHRVAGLEPPRFEDTEATLDELQGAHPPHARRDRQDRRQGDRRRRRARGGRSDRRRTQGDDDRREPT